MAKKTLAELIHTKTQKEMPEEKAMDSSDSTEADLKNNPLLAEPQPEMPAVPSSDALQKFAKKCLDELEELKVQKAELKTTMDELVKNSDEQAKVIDHQKKMMSVYQQTIMDLEKTAAEKPLLQVNTLSKNGDLRLIRITGDKVDEIDNITKEDLKHFKFIFQDETLAIMVPRTK